MGKEWLFFWKHKDSVTSQSRGLTVKHTGTYNNHWAYTYTRVLRIYLTKEIIYSMHFAGYIHS
jgi:hypothetical protein